MILDWQKQVQLVRKGAHEPVARFLGPTFSFRKLTPSFRNASIAGERGVQGRVHFCAYRDTGASASPLATGPFRLIWTFRLLVDDPDSRPRGVPHGIVHLNASVRAALTKKVRPLRGGPAMRTEQTNRRLLGVAEPRQRKEGGVFFLSNLAMACLRLSGSSSCSIDRGHLVYTCVN